MLMKMNGSNIDDVVREFNEDSIWADPCFIAHVVTTVAGSRRNSPELIDFMTKISDSRGYSAILIQIEEILSLVKGWLENPSLEDELANAIVRGCEKSIRDTSMFGEFVVVEVRGFIESETVPVRTAVSALLALVEAIADPLEVRRSEALSQATSGRGRYPALARLRDAERHDNHGPLRKAVEEAAGIKLSADAVVAAADALIAADFHESAMKVSFASALKAVFEPLRVCLERVRQKVDVARGFDALDSASAGAARASALELFGLQWEIFRGRRGPREVDPFASAIVGQDVTRLKELIGSRDVKTIKVDVENLPLELPRPRRAKASLLEIAAGVGGQVLRYLVELHELRPEADDCTLEQAVAFGDLETIGMIWDRIGAEARVKWHLPLVSSTVFHHAEVTTWLAAEHPPWLGLARRVAREKGAFDILLGIPESDEELPPLSGLVKEHAGVLEQLGVPLASSLRCFNSTIQPADFDKWLDRTGQSLVLVEGEGGRTFGALVAVRWPKLGSTANDVWCRSFLFTLDGEEATRFSAVSPAVLFHDLEKVSVGELRLDLTSREYSVDANSSCTGGRFPALSGKVAKWGIWML
jgi:hypothetical protein